MRRWPWLHGVASLGLGIAIIWTWSAGRTEVAFALAGVFIAVEVVWEVGDRRARKREVMPELTRDQVDELRGARDLDGEVAATRRLRGWHPELRLLSAVKMIRDL